MHMITEINQNPQEGLQDAWSKCTQHQGREGCEAQKFSSAEARSIRDNLRSGRSPEVQCDCAVSCIQPAAVNEDLGGLTAMVAIPMRLGTQGSIRKGHQRLAQAEVGPQPNEE